ncbi:low molecular weight protein-tyrosine-phosphatase [Fretibacter rubidus]|uniref:low molecular weight protein-tyrosine-phosphatase n=1 Tax=Fretibacter rubidus TaxID=570162 RepID=UPI00352A77BB
MESPSVLFVCLGNICRSPTAEAVFKSRANNAGIDVYVDSAGTSGWHIGERPDPRSIEAGEAAGYDFTGQASRKVTRADFGDFDHIIAMDAQNLKDLSALCPPDLRGKLSLFLDFAPNAGVRDVPDPYYGGGDGFTRVLRLVEQASEGLLAYIAARGQG